MAKGSNSVRERAKKPARKTARLAGGPAPRKKVGAIDLMRVVVKYDVGFSNSLYIRGQGGGLSWEKGIELRNTAPDEWVWESSAPCEECEFKVLINDTCYETGENHHIYNGGIVQYTPCFS